jgi:hypothetical protein
VSGTLIKRLKTWLFITSVFAMGSGPLVVSITNHLIDSHFQTERLIQTTQQKISTPIKCIPVVDEAIYSALDHRVISQKDETEISARMAALFLAEQATRQLPARIDHEEVDEEDTLRRIEVIEFIKNCIHHHAPGRHIFFFIRRNSY